MYLRPALGADGMVSGLIKIINFNSLNGDANNAISGTIFIAPSNSGISHLPDESTSNPTVILTLGWNATRIVQVAILANGLLKARLKFNDWRAWS